MANRGNHSEYGGSPGIIQPGLEGVPSDAAAGGYGHDSTAEGAVDRRGVRDAALVARRAGLKDARGVLADQIIDPDTGDVTNIPYSEELAREDLTTGNNY